MALPDEKPVQSTLDTNLSYRISIMHSLLGKLTTRIYASRGLTSHQWKVLSILYNWPPMPAVRITNLVTLDKAAISRGVMGLLTLKLARRYLDGESGMIFVALTETGRTMYRSMASEMSSLQRGLLAHVSATEQSSLYGILDKVEHALRIAAGSGAMHDANSWSRKTRKRSAPAAKKKPAVKAKSRRIAH